MGVGGGGGNLLVIYWSGLQSELWRNKHEEVTLKNGWKIKIFIASYHGLTIFISSFIALDV